ncbi:uncharacterized protein EV420DRAFT_1539907 [Desarmillaria tabescens]|uniref:Uncharacterized protein n=1 Tax=Armillaria tabescens TaxID=1929756 RepID=A0AA39KI51_ARMTA|nr:uncharacterized protein EV420DRAFT_1539907 [Desarmillaria tabescens]KAK0459373.1 hypothetical protein EV420DRAFT_1539907 [Desarmillaria tabescens]
MLNLRRSPSLCTASANGDMTKDFPSASIASETATSDLENTDIDRNILRGLVNPTNIPKQMYIVPTAVTLSNVCLLWRDIAINNPSILLRVSQKALRANSILALYLSRSKDIPLKYVVYSPGHLFVSNSESWRRRSLTECCQSFRKLATIDVMPHWLALTPSSMSLDHLTVANATTGDLVALVVIVPSFIITSISFKNCDFVHNMLDPKYPKPFVRTLSQLTSLTIILNNNFLDSLTAIPSILRCPQSPVFSRFFRRSTRLESLILKNCICLASIKTALFSQERLGYLDTQVVLGDLDVVLEAIEARLCTSRPCNAIVLRLVQMEAPSIEVEGTEEDSGTESDPEDEKSYCFGCGGVHGDVEDSDSEDDSESDEESDSDSNAQGSEKVEWRKRRLADVWPRAVPVPVSPDMLKTVNIGHGAQLSKFRAAGMRIAIVSG